MKNREPEEDLPGKLHVWKVAPLVPPGFQREVWQRIAARKAAREKGIWPVNAHPDGTSPSDAPLGLSPREESI